MEKAKQIKYIQHKPERKLSDLVKNFWKFENLSEIPYHYTILPDGCCDLIVRLLDNKIQKVALTGLWTKPIEIEALGNSSIMGIRFSPLGVEYIMQQSVAEIENSERTLGNSFWNLNTILITDFECFIEHSTTKINTALDLGKEIDKRKHNLFRLINLSKGAMSVKNLSDNILWSSRQINRYFNSRFGISLKGYCNILKVFESFKDIKKGKLYPQQSFFDQSHFIKEIKKQTGTNPKELKKNENDRFLQLYTTSKD